MEPPERQPWQGTGAPGVLAQPLRDIRGQPATPDPHRYGLVFGGGLEPLGRQNG